MSKIVRVEDGDSVVKIVSADIVTVTAGGGASGGGGFVYVADAEPITGTVTNKVFQDTGNNVLQSFTSSAANVNLRVRASYPIVNVNGADVALTLTNGIFEALVPVTISGTQDITAQVRGPDGELQASDTISATLQAPAQLTALTFTGGYPVGQTEVKAGDTFDVSFTADAAIDALQIANLGAGDGSLITFASTTSGTVTITVPDRGNIAQALPLTAAPRDATSGALGDNLASNASASVDGVNTIVLNNVAPTNNPGAITYPATQGALKNSESADVAWTFANADTVVFDSPTSELQITNPNTIEATKVVTRISGTLNESTANVRAVATRTANGSTSTAQTVVVIQNVAPAITVSVPQSRLRSGGNDGTSAQDYTVTITSDQDLGSAPSLAADSGGNRGTLIGGGFTGSGKVWTRSIRVDETVPDEKGVFSFESPQATNLAGIVTSSIASGQSYELGGFVPRNVTFGAFQNQASIDVVTVDFAKIQAGIFESTNGQSVKQPIGTANAAAGERPNEYTIAATDVDPTVVRWLDTAAVNANSGGTARLLSIEEVV